MGTASARKRSNPKPNSKSQSSQNSMSYPAPPFRPNYRKIILISSLALIGCMTVLYTTSSSSQSVLKSNVESSILYTIEVVNEFPHDPDAFTQGLLYAEKDILFESTGLEGHSSVRKVALQSGEVLSLYQMNASYFGEGLTLIGDRLFQVTWLQKTGFIYDRNNFSKFEKFTHEMQDGWGLATDGEILFGSDGTSALYQIDPHTFKVTRKQIVNYNGREVSNLNELEFINGQVWANVWQTDCIARISPKDGAVLGWILLHDLRKRLLASRTARLDVLNGIAWDKDQNRLFVTGKWWPKLFEIKLHQVKMPLDVDIEQLCMPPHYVWP